MPQITPTRARACRDCDDHRARANSCTAGPAPSSSRLPRGSRKPSPSPADAPSAGCSCHPAAAQQCITCGLCSSAADKGGRVRSASRGRKARPIHVVNIVQRKRVQSQCVPWRGGCCGAAAAATTRRVTAATTPLAAGRLPVKGRHAADSDTANMDTGCWACWSNASPLQCPALQKCSAICYADEHSCYFENANGGSLLRSAPPAGCLQCLQTLGGTRQPY